MAKIKLIATDIDGTILKYNFEFNKEVKECISKLSKEGIKIVLVTGRMHSATVNIAEQLGIETPIVSYQGGLVKLGEKTLYEKHLNPKKAKEIIKWAKQNKVHLNLYMDDKLYVEKYNKIIERYTDERAVGYTVKPFDELDLNRINKMLAIDFENSDKVTGWRDYLAKKYDDITVVKSMPYFCEICHLEATKYHAVNFLKEHWKLKTEEILTIGDQDNDIDLLKAGGIKIAMGNATDNLKSVADFITDTVDNNGFVQAVERFIYEKTTI